MTEHKKTAGNIDSIKNIPLLISLTVLNFYIYLNIYSGYIPL